MSFRFPRFGRKKKKNLTQNENVQSTPNGQFVSSTMTTSEKHYTNNMLTTPSSTPAQYLTSGMRAMHASLGPNAQSTTGTTRINRFQSSDGIFANQSATGIGSHESSSSRPQRSKSSRRESNPAQGVRRTPLVFTHPLYQMDEEGRISLKATGKQLDTSDMAVHQEEMTNAIVKYVQDSMRHELGFQELYIPSQDAPTRVNIFASHNYRTCSKLLVFVAVSRGLSPGLWSRGLVLHAGVKSGSMLDYFRTALDEGYGILVANPNKNVVLMRDGKQRVQIPGSSTPEEHVRSLWDQYINTSKARRVYFLGYSYGGVLIKYLLQTRGDQLLRRNGAVALIESSHRIEDGDTQSVKSILAHRTMYWESNDLPFQSRLEGDAPHRTGCSCLSAGSPTRMNSNHYYVTAFCINKIKDALFRFLQVRDVKTYIAAEKPVIEPPPSVTAIRNVDRKDSRRDLKLNGSGSQISASEKHCNLCLFHFTLFDRRHHCRMCNRAVCNACSRDRLFLPGSSTAQRVCAECATEGPRNVPSNHSSESTRIHRTRSDMTLLSESSRTRSDTQVSDNLAKNSQSHNLQVPNNKLSVEDFDLLKVVGKGAFGKVMLVRKKVPDGIGSPNAIYAMKVLKKAAVFAKNQVEHTKSERRILRDIDHPFVVRLRYAFQSEDKLYLVMDYYNGGSLFFHLRKCRKFSEQRSRFYAAQLLLSMAHLHELNIAYRDLKLENILMDDKGFIALTDFGLSKENVDVPDGAKTFCGTAEYIAPELLKGMPYGKAVDWWGFGTLLFEMMTGQTPFFDRNRKRMFHNILHRDVIFTQAFSDDAKDLLTGLLRRDPAKRLGSGPMGAQEIMDHPFFASIDFDLLLKKEMEAPFVPTVTSEVDTNNVANIFTREIARDSPVTQELGATHRAQAHFEDFTYMPGSELLK